MPGLCLFHSNRQETLASLLSDVVKTPLSQPLRPEIIMTQSLGMRRWLSLRLAESLGIASNIHFKFPNQILQDVFESLIPGFDPQAKQEREMTTWKIMEIMPGCLDEKDFSPLKNYLTENGETSQIMSYQLARRIAHLFDQYAALRPDMVKKWEKGEEEDGWQSQLWNLLQQHCRQTHFANLAQKVLDNIGDVKSDRLPERISVFGVSYLPPLYLEIFSAVSEHIEVNIFFLNPCGEFWQYISSEREIARVLSRDKRAVAAEDLYLEKGNELLASWGKSGRDFLLSLMNYDYSRESGSYEDPLGAADEAKARAAPSMLKSIQSQIFNLLEGGADYPPEPLSPEDKSVRIHSCHSRRREIEVLHDQLLFMIESDPELKPEDILATAPDINPYVPLIKSVFQTPVNQKGDVFPFSIADKGLVRESVIIRHFIKLLDLPSGRFSVSSALSLLEAEAVQSRFQLFPADLDSIREWTRSANIRWGINSRHRQKLNTPATRQNTWEFGIERMLLGLAKPDSDEELFRDVLPLDEIEGNNALILGNFLDFFHKLKSLTQEEDDIEEHTAPLIRPLNTRRSLGEWSEYFKNLVDDFFLIDDQAQKESLLLNDIFNDLKDLEENAGIKLKISFEVIKRHITDNLEQRRAEDAFLAGGTTFCSMLPMRGVPFKVIVLLGMNDREFPRLNKNLSFDLMMKNPRAGDRNISDEDRYIFLESLLAAKDKLYISYIGQSVKDNSLIPSSSLVGELLHYLDQAFVASKDKPSARVLTRHRLQAFSPNYFKNDPSKISYSEENLEAAQTLLNPQKKDASDFALDPPEPEEEWKTIDLRQLTEFFNNPAKFLINRRLGISLESEADVLEENEPFKLDGLEQYKVRQKLTEALLNGKDLNAIEERLKAEGVMPLKAVGSYYFDLSKEKAARLAETVQAYLADKERRPALKINIQMGDWRLKGDVSSLYGETLTHYRCADITLKDRIRNWLEHLALSHISDYPVESLLIGFKNIKKDDVVEILAREPIKEPEKRLLRLLEYYWQGLSGPLPFFPKSSAAYVESLNKEKSKGDEDKALKAALNAWEGSPAYPGEKENPYIRKIFGGSDPLGQAFQEVSLAVLQPIFETLRSAK